MLYHSCLKTKFLVRPSDGVQVSLDSLRDKYLLICCVSLSLTYRNPELAHYQKFIKVYPGLVHRSGNAFELVIVANNDGSLADFDHFFSGFPGLTIPFIDSVSRANVCAFMGLTSRTNKPMIGMILDKSHKVLQDEYCGDCFLRYGADFYPFTYDKAKAVDEMHSALEERFEYSGYYSELGHTTRVSLSDLLGCEPSFKLKRTRGGDEKLWYEKMLLDACRDNSVPDLEVVYVPVGRYDTSLLESSTKDLSQSLMLPPQFAQMAAQQAFTPVEFDNGRLITIVAFGKDGRLRSRRAQFYLTKPPDEIASLFAGDSMSQVEAAYLGQVVEDHLSEIYRPFEQEEILR